MVLVVTWFRKRKRLLCLAGCSDKVLLGKVQQSAVAGTWPLCVLGHVHSAAADCVRLNGAENRPPAGTSELSRVETLKMSSKRGAQRCGGLSLGKERTGPAWEVFCVLNLDDLTQPPAGSALCPRLARRRAEPRTGEWLLSHPVPKTAREPGPFHRAAQTSVVWMWPPDAWSGCPVFQCVQAPSPLRGPDLPKVLTLLEARHGLYVEGF